MIDSRTTLDFSAARELLLKRLSEPAPGRIQLLSGPRQVGKTTLLLEIAERERGAAIYAAADGPEAALPGFWERLWGEAESRASAVKRAVLLLDEIHLMPQWAARLKGEWDRARRRKVPIHVIATGSSALRLSSGSRESLAGRFERTVLTHWSASSLSDIFGVPRSEVSDLVVRRGTYPGAFQYSEDVGRWTAYVRDSILEPAIGRDILAIEAVRKPALLRQVFGVCASSPAQIVSLQKLQGQLQDSGALETIAHYLQLLEEAFLVVPLTKHSTRAARQRAAPPKLVTLNNALLAVVEPRGIPDASRDSARYGAWVENACIAYAWNSGQRVSYWREEPHEVDAVLEGSWGAFAVEVKTGPLTVSDLRGLGEFTRRFPKYVPLVLCDELGEIAATRAGFRAMSWKRFLLGGPNAP
jgi:predicted AAA+ superfamily ATPase